MAKMTLKKMKPGIEVYVKIPTSRLERAAGMGMFSWGSIQIITINEKQETVYASRGAPDKGRWYNKSEWSKWRLDRPKQQK